MILEIVGIVLVVLGSIGMFYMVHDMLNASYEKDLLDKEIRKARFLSKLKGDDEGTWIYRNYKDI
jgi:hypothetical protein